MVADSETIPTPCGSSSEVGGHLAVKSAYLNMIRKNVVSAHYIQSLGLCVFSTLRLAPSKQFRHSPLGYGTAFSKWERLGYT